MPLELLKAGARETEDQEYLWTLNFGPQHPATHTTLRLILTLDGETVVKAVPDIGFLHSGFEKLGEDLDYNQYVTIVDRMDYSAPIYNELAWHGATEKLMAIELTPRTKVLRTIAGELGRIQSHLLCVGAAGLDLGAFPKRARPKPGSAEIARLDRRWAARMRPEDPQTMRRR